MSEDLVAPSCFRDFGFPPSILRALDDAGYESPTPIQTMTIPPLLAGRDVLAQAETGTGKTAAFALPILTRLNLAGPHPQVLVLTPTRELAIQVAEAFQRYARHLHGLHVLPIYGGQSYDGQLRQLKRGAHVVVGTPGRVMDHMRRGTLRLDGLRVMVLDEADEMLRMGFIGDVEWILEQTPAERQTALFSATIPPPISNIARRHMRDPEEICARVSGATAETIQQRYWMVSGLHKIDALTRILEFEPFEAMLIFVRTKIETETLAMKLEARGFTAAALNGDLRQVQRERVVQRLKSGDLDIVVATDVAARGLDVERISHVVNYDIPCDIDSYIHRVGRTGRAGRTGQAILFITPRERRMLRAIERATSSQIDLMRVPTTEDINDRRIEQFKQRITETLAAGDLDIYSRLVEQYRQEQDIPSLEVAAALARMLQGDRPFLMEGLLAESPALPDDVPASSHAEPAAIVPQSLSPQTFPPPPAPKAPLGEAAPVTNAPAPATPPADRPSFSAPRTERPAFSAPRPERPSFEKRPDRPSFEKRPERPSFEKRPERPSFEKRPAWAGPDKEAARGSKTGHSRDEGLERYRLEVGTVHGARPGAIVGALANEGGIASSQIGRIEMRDQHSLVDLPADMSATELERLRKIRVAGRPLNMTPWSGPDHSGASGREPWKGRSQSATPYRKRDDGKQPPSGGGWSKPRFGKPTGESGWKGKKYDKPHSGGGWGQGERDGSSPAGGGFQTERPPYKKGKFGKPGGGRFEKPGAGRFDKPGSDRFERPGAGRFEKPGSGRFEKPGSDRFERPGGGRFERPGAGRFEKPGSDRFERPGAGRFEKPGAGRFEKPGADRFEKPGASKDWGRKKFERPGSEKKWGSSEGGGFRKGKPEKDAADGRRPFKKRKYR